MRLRPLLLAFLLAPLAGCIQPGGSPSASPADVGGLACVPGAQAIPHGAGHEHRDPAQHRFACHAHLLDSDGLQEHGASAAGVVGAHAVDAKGDLLAVGVNAGDASAGQQGFHLYDIAEPGKLRHLSFYQAPQPVGGDRTIAFSEDGKTVFLGYEGKDVRPGVAAIDVSDPADPKEAAFWSDPENFGAHTIGAGTIAGVQHVFVLALGVNILRYEGGRFVPVGKYVANDGLSVLDAPGSATGPDTYALRSLYGHDMTFFQDPVSGRPLLFVAYAYDGLKILDLTVPSAPILLGRWMPPPDSSHRHYTHSVAAERLDDAAKTLLVVVGSESFEPENQHIASPLWVLDASATVAADPLAYVPAPAHFGTWRNPSDAPAGNLGLSVHFFRLEGGLLYISHYHGGVWAVDLRTAEQRVRPEAWAYIMPLAASAVHGPEECCGGFDLSGAPMVFDVAVQDGIVYAADTIQGVSAIAFDPPGKPV